EVARALAETVGVKVADFSNAALLATPEKMKLAPDSDLSPKLKVPKTWKRDGLPLEKTHVLKVRRARPANALSILELDKWFIPGEEKCQIKYGLEGDGKCADKVQLDVFGSNYCECTDWGKGLGTYGAATDLVDEPVFAKDLAAQAEERKDYEMPDAGWKGEATATKGLLSRKTGTAANRHINVAFSPYTAHFRYWKADGDKKARLILQPFWPQWEETETKPAVTPTVEATQIKLSWTNAAKADRGVVLITDKNGQRVHLAALADDKLAAGPQEVTWDKKYRPDATNSKFGREYLDDNDNKPYTYQISTFVRQPKVDSLKIKWKIKDSGGKLERGLLQ
ncbi:MAG: hypothetical protein ACRD68_19050, partial [Pyrinomonadaceae bacterium]